MKKYLFLIRSYNDIDHITPIIDYILENNISEVYLYSTVPNKLIFPNENLDYLRNEYDLVPVYLLDCGNNLLIKYVENIYIYFLLNITSIKSIVIGFIQDKFIYRIRVLLKYLQAVFLSNKLREIYLSIKPDLICYDWTDPSAFPYGIITRMAKADMIPLISVPHGLYVWLTVDSTGKGNFRKRNKEVLRLANNEAYDGYIVQNMIKKRHTLDCGVKEKTIVTLGSVRYESSWINKQKRIFKQYNHLKNCKNTKIVVFPSKLHYGGNLSEYIDIIENISKVSDCVILKPHTRHMRLYELNNVLKRTNIYVVSNKISSTALIEWCDIGVVWGSSIGLQLIMLGKPLLYPKYAHNIETIYDKYLPETVINNTSELIDRINDISKDYKLNYSINNKDKLIKDIIYDGDNETSVVQRYIDYFDTITSN